MTVADQRRKVLWRMPLRWENVRCFLPSVFSKDAANVSDLNVEEHDVSLPRTTDRYCVSSVPVMFAYALARLGPFGLGIRLRAP